MGLGCCPSRASRFPWYSERVKIPSKVLAWVSDHSSILPRRLWLIVEGMQRSQPNLRKPWPVIFACCLPSDQLFITLVKGVKTLWLKDKGATYEALIRSRKAIGQQSVWNRLENIFELVWEPKSALFFCDVQQKFQVWCDWLEAVGDTWVAPNQRLILFSKCHNR